MNPFAALSLRRKRLICASVGAFFACALLPGTGPLVRHTLVTAVKGVTKWGRSSGDSDDEPAARLQAFRVRAENDHTTAAQAPDDFPVHLAACERRTPDDYLAFLQGGGAENTTPSYPPRPGETDYFERIAHELTKLAPRFDDNPSYHAAILRNLSAHAVRLGNRNDDEILYERPFGPLEPAPLRENLLAWHKAAQAGERLEPQNAYFPFMDAAALFAEHRDENALDALHRAGLKSSYNDYVGDEATGYLRLEEAEGREQTALSRLVAMMMQTYPHYSLLRNLARIAIAKAVEAELQNRPEDGFAIRRDVRRIGANLRLNSPAGVGSQVGSSIALTTARRPGGSALVSDEKQTDTAAALPVLRYENHLRRIGHSEEANAFAYEVREQADNHHLFEQVQDNPAFIFNLPRIARMVLVSTGSLLLLTNALLVLIAGGLAAIIAARVRAVRRGLPLPHAVRAGIGSAVLLPTSASLVWWGIPAFWEWAGAELFLSLTGGVVVLGGVVYWLCFHRHGLRLRMPRFPKTNAKTLFRAVFLWAGGVLGVYGVVAALGFASFIGGLASWSDVGELGLLTSDADNGNPFNSECFFALTVFVTPLLMALCAFWSRKFGVPASVGMVRGIKGLAVPIACVLILLTVPLTIWRGFEDAALNRDLKRASKNANRYMAEISGKPWPLHNAPVEGTRP